MFKTLTTMVKKAWGALKKAKAVKVGAVEQKDLPKVNVAQNPSFVLAARDAPDNV